jgi:hypothetical protein
MPKNVTVRLYDPVDAPRWNEFVRHARNATFLFDRGFMDYHSDRFADYSLVITSGDKWLAVLPAHRKDKVVLSHWGLTYGGLVYGNEVHQSDVIMILKGVLEFLADGRIDALRIKLLPRIYPDKPSDELAYALFLADARLIRRDSLSVIDQTTDAKISRGRMEGIKRGQNHGLSVVGETDFSAFWNKILIPNLQQKHNASPVHSLEEIELLHSRFPSNIKHFNVYKGDEIVAGTTLFVTENVVHSQYISADERKNELGSVDFLYHHLLGYYRDKRYFDFGISNESDGRKLNDGLIFWKESFGATTVAQDFYEVETKNSVLLDDVLL